MKTASWLQWKSKRKEDKEQPPAPRTDGCWKDIAVGILNDMDTMRKLVSDDEWSDFMLYLESILDWYREHPRDSK